MSVADELVDVFAETHRLRGVRVVEVRTDQEVLSPSAALSGLPARGAAGLGRRGSSTQS